MDAGGKSADGERLGEAGDTFQQDVAISEEADQKATHEALLADDDATYFLRQGLHPCAGFFYTAIEFLDGWIHKVCFSFSV